MRLEVLALGSPCTKQTSPLICARAKVDFRWVIGEDMPCGDCGGRGAGMVHKDEDEQDATAAIIGWLWRGCGPCYRRGLGEDSIGDSLAQHKCRGAIDGETGGRALADPAGFIESSGGDTRFGHAGRRSFWHPSKRLSPCSSPRNTPSHPCISVSRRSRNPDRTRSPLLFISSLTSIRSCAAPGAPH